MKILIKVNNSNDDCSDLWYAVVNLDDKTKAYLDVRRAIFESISALAEDLLDIRFWSSLLSFYKNLDIDDLDIDEDEFLEDGFFVLPEEFEAKQKPEDLSGETLEVDEDGWLVKINCDDGILETRQIPFEVEEE